MRGIWRRIVLQPFLRQFGEHERDPHLEDKLYGERDGSGTTQIKVI
ncbi:MAG: hypothetical protein RJA36_2610 [Pseudomonadota bacterium]|jgi:phage/plasmid-associated DNA primase